MFYVIKVGGSNRAVSDDLEEAKEFAMSCVTDGKPELILDQFPNPGAPAARTGYYYYDWEVEDWTFAS